MTVKVIPFEQRNIRASRRRIGQAALKETACASPIVLERWSNDIVSLAFHIRCFSIDFLEICLCSLNYGEESIWQLCKMDKEPSSAYVKYFFILQKDFGDKTEDVLTSIISKAVKEAYLEELRCWENEVKVSDLTKPHQYQLRDGANIGGATERALLSAGLDTGWDLTDLTRDEICQISGMTTEGVAKLEKSLASRGLFLKTRLPSV